MSQPDALMRRTSSIVDPVELGPEELESGEVELGEILGTLAHEFRNPLASLQGCAQTLVERGDDLDAEIRERMAEVIVKHAKRLDWLVRAAATFGGAGGVTDVDDFDLGEIIDRAAAFAGVDARTTGALTLTGSARRLQLALEALLLALGEEATVEMDGTTIRLSGSQTDVQRGSRRWKFHLASRVLREDGATVHVMISSHGTSVTIRTRGGGTT